MDETTTDAATQDEAHIDPTVEAQPPVDEQPAEAVPTDSEPTSPTDTPETTEEEPAPADTSTEDELSDEQVLEWAEKKGIDLSTPEGQAKALRSLRSSEKKMHQATSQASELATQLGQEPVDPDASTAEQALHMAQQLRDAETIRSWKSQHNVTPQEDAAMGKYVSENPQVGHLLRNGLISLDQVRTLSGAGSHDVAAIKAQAKKEALEELASKQGAGAPGGGATTGAPAPKADEIASVWDD